MKKVVLPIAFLILFTCKAPAQTVVSAKNAGKHIGKTVKICDKVFGGRLLTSSNITLLDIGGNSPNQELTIMIPAGCRNRFKGRPEVDYRGKDVIVTGRLALYKGKPEIVITRPEQFKIVLIDNNFNHRIPVKQPVH